MRVLGDGRESCSVVGGLERRPHTIPSNPSYARPPSYRHLLPSPSCHPVHRSCHILPPAPQFNALLRSRERSKSRITSSKADSPLPLPSSTSPHTPKSTHKPHLNSHAPSSSAPSSRSFRQQESELHDLRRILINKIIMVAGRRISPVLLPAHHPPARLLPLRSPVKGSERKKWS
jgi:hypothetical protein